MARWRPGGRSMGLPTWAGPPRPSGARATGKGPDTCRVSGPLSVVLTGRGAAPTPSEARTQGGPEGAQRPPGKQTVGLMTRSVMRHTEKLPAVVLWSGTKRYRTDRTTGLITQ